MRFLRFIVLAALLMGNASVPAQEQGPDPDPDPNPNQNRAFIRVGDIKIARAAFVQADTSGKATMLCALCHGENGAGDRAFGKDVNFGTPVIVGLEVNYMLRRLGEFKASSNGEMSIIMNDPAMDEQTVRDLVQHFATLPSFALGKNPAALAKPNNAKAFKSGSHLFMRHCASCHGPQALGNAVITAPRIAGQNALYIQARLKAWQKASPHHTSPMQAVLQAKPLDQTQRKHLAFYLENLVDYSAIPAGK